MANGQIITPGNSKLLLNAVGVSDLFYKGWYLGKTNGGLTVNFDADFLDVLYQQEGTKKADDIMTGLMYSITVPFAQLSTKLLTLITPGISSSVVDFSAEDDSMVIGRDMYQSRRDNEGGVLKIAACGPDGVASEELEDIMNFYSAVVKPDGALLNYEAGTQRTVPVTFEIYWNRFTTPHSYRVNGAFGYVGDPVSENVAPVVWPDVSAPIAESAEATLVTSITVTFNKNVQFVGGSYTNGIAAKINEVDFVEPTNAAITDDEMTLTFAAATFEAGDDIELYIGAEVIEDTGSNAYPGIDGMTVTNSIST
jgi:hypothetical protein